MKKMLIVLALLSLNLSSYSSGQDDKAKKIACTIGLLLVPIAALGGPAALSSAASFWAQACIKPKGSGSNTVVFKKDW